MSAMLTSLCSGETITVTDDSAVGVPVPPFTGAVDLVKDGDGTFTLSGSNTYTGTTQINAGTLKVTSTNGLTKTSRIRIASGAILDLGASNALGVGSEDPPAIEINGGMVQTSFKGHVNLGNVLLNGGSLYSASSASDHGNFLLAGTVTVTADSSIECNKILIRGASQQAPSGNAGKFIVNSGSTLTLAAQVNFSDPYDKNVLWDISGGGTVTMKKTAVNGKGARISVSGSGTTLNFAVNNIWGSEQNAMANFTINEGARVNHSSSGGHTNIGNITLNGGALTAVDLTTGNKVNPSAYGHYLVCGAITVLSDSEISADTYFRKRSSNPTAGDISIAEGATLTVSGTINFAGGSNSTTNNESGNIVISGGGKLVVPSGGGLKNSDSSKNTITVRGKGTTLQFGDGGSSGWWSVPVIIEDGGTLVMDRGSVGGNFALPITASNGTFSNNGTCTITLASPITVLDSDAEIDLTVNGKSQFNFSNGTLTGSGTVLKTGTNVLAVGGTNDFSGNIIVREGTLSVNASTALGTCAVVLDGGTLQKGGSGKIVLPTTLEVRSDSTINVAGNVLGIDGNLTGNAALTKTGNSQLHLLGDASEFAGTIVSTSSWLGFSPQGASPKAQYCLDSGATGIVLLTDSDDPAAVFSFGMLETANKNATLRAGQDTAKAGVRNVYVEVGASGMSGTYAGKIQDHDTVTLHLDKTGSGTWTLAGTNTYTGKTAVKDGILDLTGSITSDTSVQSGAYLMGTGTLDGNLSFDGGTYLVDLTQADVLEQVLSGTLLDVTGSLSADDNTLVLELVADASVLELFTEDEKYSVMNVQSPDDQLLAVSLELAEAAGVWNSGYDARTGDLWIALAGEGGTSSPSVPEPSTFALLVTALGFFGLRGVRHRKTAG